MTYADLIWKLIEELLKFKGNQSNDHESKE